MFSIEIPISSRWKVSKEKLLALNEKNKWCTFSDKFEVDELPGVKYSTAIACDKDQTIALGLGIEMNGDRNINVSCKFSFPLVNKLLTENEKLQMTSTSNVYVTRFGTFNELMDPANNFIVDDYLIIKMEAILIIAKNKTDTVSNIQQSNCCKLGSKLWERDDKDFVIIVDGKEIKLHKNVISAESSVFERMIESGMQESKESKVTIIDFNFETVEKAFKFCYGFEDPNLWSIDSAVNLLQFADKYDIKELKISSETFLSSEISVMNVCKIANAAILSNSIKLQQKCFEFILECNQKKNFVTDLEILDKDFAVELMKASFSNFSETILE